MLKSRFSKIPNSNFFTENFNKKILRINFESNNSTNVEWKFSKSFPLDFRQFHDFQISSRRLLLSGFLSYSRSSLHVLIYKKFIRSISRPRHESSYFTQLYSSRDDDGHKIPSTKKCPYFIFHNGKFYAVIQ